MRLLLLFIFILPVVSDEYCWRQNYCGSASDCGLAAMRDEIVGYTYRVDKVYGGKTYYGAQKSGGSFLFLM